MPPRLIRPKDEPDSSPSRDSPSESKSGKRKAVSSACIPCRKRKSKCDGAMPSCSTCTAVYRTECSYDSDSDHRRKGALKRDIRSLQQQNDALDVIVASLRTLPEDEATSLLHNLRHETSPEVLAAALRSNVRLPHSFAPQTLEADFADEIAQSATRTTFDAQVPFRPRQSSDTASNSSSAGAVERPTTWFRLPQDAESVEHLLNLYFCWLHPFYQLFSRDHFLHDMSRGRTEFCSALLVNAVLAAACHYSDRPLARTDPNDSSTAGDFFFGEAKKLLEVLDKPTLTTVQALGIMSLRETSQGRESNGYQYAGRCVRMALELGLHLSTVGSALRPAEIEVRKITFWGVFNLETLCSVAFGRLSQLPLAAADIPRPSMHDRIESQRWMPYDDSNLAASPSAEQYLRPMLFLEQLCKLSELASEMVNTFYAPRERFTSRRLSVAYARYQEWYQNLPDSFRLENTTLPHVIVLHMYYYACILHLFRPYVKLDLSGANLFPRDTCTFCANEISSLMSILRAMYGLRRVCLAVTNMLLSASTIHLLNLPSEPSATHISQALHDLQAMSMNHTFAARCVDIVRSLSTKWNIALPEGAAAVSAFRPSGPRKRGSPTISTFWGAPVARDSSSTQSSGSSASTLESPFPPPAQTVQAQAPYATFFNDPTTPLDPNQTQTAFWIPFPGQTMPVPSQHVVPSMAIDMTDVNDHSASWQVFGNGAAAAGHTAQRSQTMPDHHMHNTGQFPGWNWQ